MPPKKKQRLLSKREQEKARQDFLEKITNDEETPFNKEVSFEALDQSLKYFLWLWLTSWQEWDSNPQTHKYSTIYSTI